MFEFIRNLFPYKAKSLEGFVEHMQREGCKEAVAEPRMRVINAYTKNAMDGVTTGDFQYMLEFTATAPNGRQVVYLAPLVSRFGSERSFADAEDRRRAAIKLFLHGEQMIRDIKSKQPDVSVDLIGPLGQLFDDTLFAKLHLDAATYSVSI